MSKKQGWSLLAAGLLLAPAARAELPKTYQVTGPIVELTDSKIVVQKGDERWELARDKNTRVNGQLKVGDKVTIEYRMISTRIDVKSEKPEKPPTAK